MTIDHPGRVGGHSWLRVAVVAAMLSTMAVLALASTAVAKSPTGEYAVFTQCPGRTNKAVEFCIYSVTKGGEVKIGKTAVPISSNIVLQGGYSYNSKTEKEEFYGASNNETLSRTPLPVPGGLLEMFPPEHLSEPLKGWIETYINEDSPTSVFATTELVKPASDIGINTSNLFGGEGVALTLPVRVHLENLFLGLGCFIGSSSHPITLNLTTGSTSPEPPNKSITGHVGKLRQTEDFNFIELNPNTLVDNSFSAPEASGCGAYGGFFFELLVDAVVNEKLGLPSADGNNTAILSETQVKEGVAEDVVKSEK
jgi:hypothetical protein